MHDNQEAAEHPSGSAHQPQVSSPAETNPIHPAQNTEITQATDTMEVHHHAHHNHGKKSWKYYFWEFFMLFLAVFCGFLAEYQLEHKIENDRAKELAKSLYTELREDSIRLNKVLELRELKEQVSGYLMNYFETADFTKNADSAFRCIAFAFLTVSNRIIFEPSDGILFQLQNSGSRRYFKSQTLQDAISKLYTSISFIRIRNERELSYITNTLRPFCIRHLDFKWIGKYMKDGKLSLTDAFLNNHQVEGIPALFKKPHLIDRDEAINITGESLVMLRGLKTATLPDYRAAATALMKLLREEFDLK